MCSLWATRRRAGEAAEAEANTRQQKYRSITRHLVLPNNTRQPATATVRIVAAETISPIRIYPPTTTTSTKIPGTAPITKHRSHRNCLGGEKRGYGQLQKVAEKAHEASVLHRANLISQDFRSPRGRDSLNARKLEAENFLFWHASGWSGYDG